MATDAGNIQKELRRDRRFEVVQAAIIVSSGRHEITCEIRDFCLGGLFLKFTNPDQGFRLLSELDGTQVEVIFTPATPGNAQTHHIIAQLKRLSTLGVGVAFGKQPVEALRALQKLRMLNHRLRFAASHPVASSQSMRENCETLLRETLGQAQDQLSYFIDGKLSYAAAHAASISEHSSLLAASEEFRRNPSLIREKFIRAVMESFDRRRLVTEVNQPSAEGGLALVDEVDFEDWLGATSEATKLEESFREQLAEIEPRIGQVYAFGFDHTTNPYGPVVICHAYRTAIQDLPIPTKARLVAYNTLREVLAEQLEPMYGELLELLPTGAADTRTADRSPPLSTPEHPELPASEGNPELAPATGTTGPKAAPGASAPTPGTLGRITGALMDWLRRDRPSGVAASPQAGQSYSPAAYPTSTGGGMAGAGMAGAGMAGAGMAGAGMAGAGMAGGGMAGGGMAGGAMPPSPVLQRLSAAGALPQNLAPEMQRTVDLFGALFDTMHDEKSISEGIRPFFQRMETSLIQLAIADPAFLNSPNHPAHKVLNTLDRISMVSEDDGEITDERLLKLMKRWTDRISTEAEKNPGVYEEARTQLERVVKPLMNERAARISRLQDVLEGRQRAENAKRRILGELAERLGSQTVANVVIELINSGWRNYLLREELRHGAESEPANQAWKTLETLSAWLAQERTSQPTAEAAQQLLQHIDTGLSLVCHDKHEQDRILDRLADLLLDADNTTQVHYSAVSTKLQRPESTEAVSAEQCSLLEHFRVGDWVQFAKLKSPLNLIWVGDDPPVYVFSNYRGIKKLDLRRREFLQALENSEAQLTEDMELPLMDRTYSAMIQKMQRDLLWYASHDPVTGLVNRREFFRSIRRNWLRSGTKDTGYVFGILNLDISHSPYSPAKIETRNQFLCSLAIKVQGRLPENSLLARAGEQAFAFWSTSVDPESAKTMVSSLVRELGQNKQHIEDRDYSVAVCAGLMWTPDCIEPETYYDNANAACAAAKQSGPDEIVLFSDEASAHRTTVTELADWAHKLGRILAEDRMELYCQAVVAIGGQAHTPVHHEILLRSMDGPDDRINTGELIAAAERLQRITEVDRWVVRHVFQWIREHAADFELIGGFSINLSGQSIFNPLFLNFLLAELGKGDIPGHKIIFEITETAAIEGFSQAQHFIRQIRRFGCKFTLDDFGVGYCSFTYLKNLKVDYLKIDGSFVKEIAASGIDESLVRSMRETSSFLGIKTIAEFVENAETLAKLKEIGVDYAQGYFFGRPVPLKEVFLDGIKSQAA